MKEYTYKYTVIRKRFLQFCRKHNASPEEIISYCEGSLRNFPYWYVDYLNCIKKELKNRIRTGTINKIELKDVWS